MDIADAKASSKVLIPIVGIEQKSTTGGIQEDVVKVNSVEEIEVHDGKNYSDRVISYTKTLEYDLKYYMSHLRRGHACIFHHVNFRPHLNLKKRKDCNSDAKGMETILKSLGFDVKCYTDLSKKNIEKKVTKLAAKNHLDCDCVLIAVFTHGIRGQLYAEDDKYSPTVLWESFLPDKCPTLAGKPKIFIIQACTGSRVDYGTILTKFAAEEQDLFGKTKTDASVVFAAESGYFPYSIPHYADLVIAFSTLPGFYSFRNELPSVDFWSFKLFGIFPVFVPRNMFRMPSWMQARRIRENPTDPKMRSNASSSSQPGSWFIQTLISVLDNFSDKEDLLSMLTMTACRVATRFESFSHDDSLHLNKQIPCFHSTLTRKVHFVSKYNDSKVEGSSA